MNLAGQVALVSGANRGIGKAIAAALADAGARVVLVARKERALAEVAAALSRDGASVSWHASDISREDEVEALFDAIDREHGRLDVLVNNAGVGAFGHLHELAVEAFDRAMAVNVRGTFLCCRAGLIRMIPQGHGAIINVSSVVGFKGYREQSAYAASKHGVMGLTKSLAVEAQQHGIRVSAVLPGGVDTDMVRASRPDLDPGDLLLPEDVAQAVMYLLSLSPRAAVDQIYLRRRGSTPFP